MNQVDPQFKVDTTKKLFSLVEEDVDDIIAPLALGQKRLVKRTWQAGHPS